jgi:hypothetical protein
MKAFLFRTLRDQVRLPVRLKTDRDAPLAERKNGIEHRTLDAATTDALSLRCREHGTTVHGALVAAMVLAAGDDLGRAATLGCFSAVNLRADLTERLEGEAGNYISQVTTFHRAGSPFWPLAEEARDRIAHAKATDEHHVTMPNMGMFIPSGKNPGLVLARRLTRLSPAAIGVTNVGLIHLHREYGALTVDAVNVCVGMSAIGRLASAVGTFAGRLAMNVIFVEPLVSRARAALVADRAHAVLCEAAR